MNFIEAVQALKDGRCEGIRRESWRGVHDDFLQLQDGWLVWNYSNIEKVAGKGMILADDWQLVNEKPQVVEVEVVQWYNIHDGGCYCEREMDNLGYSRKAENWVKLTGTYTHPVPRKVKRREYIGTVENHSTLIGMKQGKYPPDAKCYAEWEEESP